MVLRSLEINRQRGSKRDRERKNSSVEIGKINVFYPDSMKARVVVEELHLFCRKWPQNLLNGEELEKQFSKLRH